MFVVCVFFFQAEYGIRDLVRSRGLGDVYKRQRWEDIQCAQKYQQDYNHQQDCAGDSDRRLALALRHGGDGSCQILRAFPFEGADRLLWAHGMVISIWAFARSACNQSASALACRLSFASVVKGYESTCSMTSMIW